TLKPCAAKEECSLCVTCVVPSSCRDPLPSGSHQRADGRGLPRASARAARRLLRCKLALPLAGAVNAQRGAVPMRRLLLTAIALCLLVLTIAPMVATSPAHHHARPVACSAVPAPC